MGKKILKICMTAAMSAFVFAAHGCGYHIAGKGGAMPGDMKSLSIPVFTNATAKPDIESILTSAFVSEFMTTLEIKEQSDAVMQVTIKSYTLTPVSYTRNDVNQEYRLTVALSVRLYKKEGDTPGKLLLSDEDIVDNEDYTVNISDLTATRDRETEALKKLAKDTARLTKEHILEGF
ncbi:MAG: LptE family protein [Deltaproteobacteria bacterium]